MRRPDFDNFRSRALAEGFDEVIERRWPPLTVLDTHTVDGEMWLAVNTETRHLGASDSFKLARKVAHAERYSEHGACYCLARRTWR